MEHLTNFYLSLQEPTQSCFIALRNIILDSDDKITEHWKYRLPFFYYRGKPFCYLWKDKITQTPYIGICRGDQIDHPHLDQGNRKKMKVLSINPDQDIPVEIILEVLEIAKDVY